MEPSTGAPIRAHGLRALGQPRPVEVLLVGGTLRQVTVLPRGRGGAAWAFEVETVQEVWRVAEAWWRESPVRRTYYQVLIDGGRALTLFEDEETGQWFEQRY